MRDTIIKVVLWILLFILFELLIGFMNLVFDIREDKRIERQLKKGK